MDKSTLLADISKVTALSYAVDIVCDRSVPALCSRPYAQHPRGCPNVARCSKVPWFLDEYQEVGYVATLRFDFGTYLDTMRAKHPNWSDRQLRCPLYWQGHARKAMRTFVDAQHIEGYEPVWIPEAMGVNVTETCKNAGITLEWPPMTKTYVVVLFARPLRALRKRREALRAHNAEEALRGAVGMA